MILLKVGGGAGINLEGIASDIAELDEPFLILHGANALRDETAKKIGYAVERLVSVSGVSSVHTDEGLLDLMMMTYSGLQNKRIVEMLQRRSVNAVGLCGMDGGLIRGRRNRGIRVRRNGKTLIVRDRSGRGEEVNGNLLRLLLDGGYTPVLTVPILDEDSRAMNTENDDLLPLLNREVAARTVILLVEERGFLREAGNPESLIPSLNPDELSAWRDQLQGRIARKLRGIEGLLEEDGAQVIIADGRREHPVADALAGMGTVIVK